MSWGRIMADGLIANCRQTFKTGITNNAESQQTTILLPISCPKILPPQRGKKPKQPERYLIFGFDSEYVGHEAVSKDQIKDQDVEIKNEILSYQYSLKIVSENINDPELTVEGIIVPEDGIALELSDFMVFALGHFTEKHPHVVLPKHIYLVAHFTRADLPGFAGFKQLARSFLSNIRNTFVSLNTYIPLTVSSTNEEITRFQIMLRDTVLLAPANAKKLSDVGEIVGFKKEVLGGSSKEDLRIKMHGMRDLRDNNWNIFKSYAIRDATICVLYAEKLMRQNKALSGKLQLPVTLTSFGTQMVQQDWLSKQWKPVDVLGREIVKTRSYDKRAGKYKYKTKKPFIEALHYESNLATEPYHGGRNEQFMFGICERGVWRDHDLSSAYTTAMSVIGFPDWNNIEIITQTHDIKPTDLAFFWVEFSFPKKIRFPTLPVRCEGGIIFPREGLSKCAAPEIVLARQLGAKLKVKRAAYVPTDAKRPIFKDFIVNCITNRSEHEKGSFENLFWKEIGNSTYGKTAQGLKKKRVYDMREDNMVMLPESALTQPFLASFITSYTRAVLGEILNGFSKDVDVFSVTTDGFLSNASDEELEQATSGNIYNSFSQARKGLETDAVPLEVKHEIVQPIGWRTRGSATLEAGEGKNNILLQKGGIKVDPNFDVEQENDFIIELFLNRFPGQKLDYTIGIGLKDMIHHDTDFVSRSVTKRLSMEFDWKRRPSKPKDKNIEFNGKKYNHLSFKTVPLENKKEFDDIRATWEKYASGDNNERTLLKTAEELHQFENYKFQKENPHGSKRSYIPKEDADMRKLKTSLTRAFKQGKAGFPKSINGKKITHEMFISQLKQFGIECTISDLDNAKRFPYEPHTAGFTIKSARAAWNLSRKYYPKLDLHDIFDERYELNVGT